MPKIKKWSPPELTNKQVVFTLNNLFQAFLLGAMSDKIDLIKAEEILKDIFKN